MEEASLPLCGLSLAVTLWVTGDGVLQVGSLSFAQLECRSTKGNSIVWMWCIITFRMRCSRGEIYIGDARLCVCVSVCLSLAAFPHYCTDPDVTRGNGRGAL